MADHAVGSRISLISKSEIRYEGFLNFINAKENTVGLKNVRMHGTEGRKNGQGEIPAGDKLYEYIVFRGADIKDLTVYEDSLPDPAIISAQPAQTGNSKDNAWNQNREHRPAQAGGRGRGGQSYGGQQSYNNNQQSYNIPAPRGRGGYQHDAPAHHTGGRGAQQSQRGRGFSDRRPMGAGAPQQHQQHQQQHQQHSQQQRAPRLEHTGREFAPVQGAPKEFKEDFDFSKARADFHQETENNKAAAEGKKAYDKTSSFFDNLSSDVTDRKDRARGQAFREQQKKVDTETFGNDFVGAHANTRYRRGGHGRGRGRYGTRN
jgi:protein LSM14